MQLGAGWGPRKMSTEEKRRGEAGQGCIQAGMKLPGHAKKASVSDLPLGHSHQKWYPSGVPEGVTGKGLWGVSIADAGTYSEHRLVITSVLAG